MAPGLPRPGGPELPADLSNLTIEDLVSYLDGLKKDREAIEKQEAKAMATLKQKLKDAINKADQLEKKPADSEALKKASEHVREFLQKLLEEERRLRPEGDNKNPPKDQP